MCAQEGYPQHPTVAFHFVTITRIYFDKMGFPFSLPELPKTLLNLNTSRQYLILRENGRVRHRIGNPSAAEKPWPVEFKPSSFLLVSKTIRTCKGSFGVLNVWLTIDVTNKSQINTLVNCRGDAYITCSFDPTFNGKPPDDALFNTNLTYPTPPPDWASQPYAKWGVQIQPDMYAAIAMELAVYKHIIFNPFCKLVDNAIGFALCEAIKGMPRQCLSLVPTNMKNGTTAHFVPDPKSESGEFYKSLKDALRKNMDIWSLHRHTEIIMTSAGRKFLDEKRSPLPFFCVRSTDTLNLVCNGIQAVMDELWPPDRQVPNLMDAHFLKSVPVWYDDLFPNPDMSMHKDGPLIGAALIRGLPSEQKSAIATFHPNNRDLTSRHGMCFSRYYSQCLAPETKEEMEARHIAQLEELKKKQNKQQAELIQKQKEQILYLQKACDAADADAERQRAQDRAIFYHWVKNTKPVFEGWAKLTEPQRAERREAEAKTVRQKEAAEARERAAQRKLREKAKEAARKAELDRELAVPLSAAEIEEREKEAERRRIAEAERERKQADKSNTLSCDLKARPQHGPKEGIQRRPTFKTEHERVAHEDFVSPAQREARREEGRAQNAEKKRVADNKKAEQMRKREEDRAWRSGGTLEPAPMLSLADWRAPKASPNSEHDGHSVHSLATTCVNLNPITHAVERGILRSVDRREAQWTRKHGKRESSYGGRVVLRGRPNGVDLVIDPATDRIITVYPARAKLA